MWWELNTIAKLSLLYSVSQVNFVLISFICSKVQYIYATIFKGFSGVISNAEQYFNGKLHDNYSQSSKLTNQTFLSLVNLKSSQCLIGKMHKFAVTAVDVLCVLNLFPEKIS